MKPAMLGSVAIGLALTYVIGYHGMYTHHNKRAQQIEAQIVQEQTQRKAKEEVAALLKQMEQSREQFSPSPDAAWLVREAVSLGRKAGLELKTISQEDPKKVQQFTYLSANLRFTATYHQLGTFLDYLERSGRFIRIDRLEINEPQKEGGSAPVEVVLSTLYLPPEVGDLTSATSQKR